MLPRLVATVCLFSVLLFGAAIDARADSLVYDNSLASPWQDWSWDPITRNLAQTTVVHGSPTAISVLFTGGWSGLQFGRNAALDVSAFDSLHFFVHGGPSGGQNLRVTIGNASTSLDFALTPTAGQWTEVNVPLLALGSPRSVTYLYWFNNTAGSQPIFYLDDIVFTQAGLPTPTPVPPGQAPRLRVDAQTARHPISPLIYGMNFADETLASELHLPLNRWGGNATTRYNYLFDTSNHAFDWFFENIPDDNPNPQLLPNGSTTDRFIQQNRRTGTDTLLTVPLIGWTPKSRVRLCGFSVLKYGAQQSTDPYNADCGNGVRTNGTRITGNDPHDTSTAIGPDFVQGWMSHLASQFGDAASGGVRFYNLDNEPMLWNDTHRDAHPSATSYDEMRDRTFAYASAIKLTDPTARTFGPAEWGWSGYFWSALDAAPGGAWWNNPQDRLAHGNVPFADWYLQQMHTYEQQHGTRILDYFDLHYYPQSSGVSLSGAGDAATQALRLRSTRSLWDPTYADESWIGEVVRLLPRMRDWVQNNYPGTKIAIGEYNWGAYDHINGALAQADVLGIFGRESLDAATLWTAPSTAQPVTYAFRIFRNYDGAGATFGDTSVSAISDDSGSLSLFAAERSTDHALTIVAINKTAAPLNGSVEVAGIAASAPARLYHYSSANLGSIVRDPDVPVTAGALVTSFPANSISLFLLSAAAAATPTFTSTPTVARTATQTPTRSATVGVGPGIAGSIHAQGTNAAVPDVQMTLRGATPSSQLTDTLGTFGWPALSAGNCEIEPNKVGGGNANITSLDAVLALQAAVSLYTPDALQRVACDVNGNGAISSIDAVLILQYRVGMITSFPAAVRCGSDWAFLPLVTASADVQPIPPAVTATSCQPGKVIYAPLAGPLAGQDFRAMQFGDCAASWQPSGQAAAIRNAATPKLGAPMRRGRRWIVPVQMAVVSGANTFEAEVQYDADQFTVAGVRKRAAQSLLLASNSVGLGHLRIAAASASGIEPSDRLYIELRAKGSAGVPRLRLLRARGWGG